MSLQGRCALVTGASRGIGRGVAVALGERGASVHVTGRRLEALEETAELVRAAGGTCCCYQVDHGDDAQIASLFRKLRGVVADGGLDILVNNVYAAVPFIMQSMDVPFWKKNAQDPRLPDILADPGEVWELVNGPGLRSHYVCSAWALRGMETNGGIIINITSWAGMMSAFDPVYAVGKSAVDRLSAEIARAAPEGVTCFSLCPGVVATEAVTIAAEKQTEVAEREGRDPHGELLPMWNVESPLFVGRVLAAIVHDDRLLHRMNGRVVIAAEAADVLHVDDENGFRCLSLRSIRFNLMKMMPSLIDSPLRFLIPRTLLAPWWFIRWYIGAVKFW